MKLIFIVSLVGFVNASILYWQHRRHALLGKRMFCFLGGDCGEVVASKFGRTLGIKNELIGLVYYGFLGLYVLISMIQPSFGKDFEGVVKRVAGVIALLSLYLLFAQTFLLRKLCSWCLVAIAVNWVLFYLLIFGF